jgi:hypothetical protein
VNYWQPVHKKAFDGYAAVLTGNLTDAAAAMRAMAGVFATRLGVIRIRSAVTARRWVGVVA